MCKTVTPFITRLEASAVIDINNKYRLNDIRKFMVSNKNLFQCCFSGSSLDGPNLRGFCGKTWLTWHGMDAGFELTVPLLVLGMASATQWKRHLVHLQNKDSQQTWDPSDPSDPTDPGIKDRKIPAGEFWWLFFPRSFWSWTKKLDVFFCFRIPKRSFYLRFGWSKRNGPTRKNWPRKKDGHVFFWPCFLNLPRMALDLSTKKSNDVFFLVYPTSDPFHTTQAMAFARQYTAWGLGGSCSRTDRWSWLSHRLRRFPIMKKRCMGHDLNHWRWMTPTTLSGGHCSVCRSLLMGWGFSVFFFVSGGGWTQTCWLCRPLGWVEFGWRILEATPRII